LKISPNFDQDIISYFTFSDKKKIKFKDEFDYILDFRSFFSIAVKNKIRGIRELGTFQSSGLDSNSILYFIAKEFKTKFSCMKNVNNGWIKNPRSCIHI
jgi:asparagine synthetase B (glutamine-hydrolysing)